MSLTRSIQSLINKFLAADENSRVLQQAGILRFALIFIQGVVLVRAGVPLAIVGQIELVFFLANFLMFYMQNGGRNALLSWAPKDDSQSSLRQRLAAVFLTMHGFGLIGGVLLLIGMQMQIPENYGFLQEGGYAPYLAVYIVFTVPVTPLIFNYLLTDRANRIIGFVGVSYLIQVLAVLLPFLLGYDLEVMVICLGVFAVCRWLFTIVDGKWFIEGLPPRELITAFIVFCLPLVFHAFNSGLMDYVDGWIVSSYFGEEMFALYRYGAKEFPVNMLLISGLLTGLIPVFRKAGKVDTDKVKHEIFRLIRILVPVNCVLILMSPLLYQWIYGAEFILSARIFNIYALTLLSRVIINQVYLYVFHHNWVLAVSTLFEIVLNIALSIILLRSIGILGIPLATAIAFAAHRLFIVMYLRMKMKASIVSYLPTRAYVLATAGMIVCFFLAEYIYF